MIEPIIEVRDLWHWYLRKTPLESLALQGASFTLAAGEVVGIMGHTGSGKSTLVQHFNGLLRPHRGSVRVFGSDLGDKHVDPRPLRRRIGLVFQFPEQQLFDPTVADDIAFGPRKLGCDHAEVRRRVQGGNGRRGPAVRHIQRSLHVRPVRRRDAQGRARRRARARARGPLCSMSRPPAWTPARGGISSTCSARCMTSAGPRSSSYRTNMDEVAELVTRVDVLADGKVVLSGGVREVFREERRLRELGLGVPAAAELAGALRERGVALRGDVLTIDDAVEAMWTSSSSPAA